MFILAEARARSSRKEVLGLEQPVSPRGRGQRATRDPGICSQVRGLEPVLGLGLPAAELVLGPSVLQLQLSLLSLWQGKRGRGESN